MHVARFRADDFGNMRQEGDDVVLDLGLDGVDAGDVELGGVAFGPDGLCGFLGDDAQFGHGVGGVRLDLEPDAELGFRRPDRNHRGTGITRDHEITAVIAVSQPIKSVAMASLCINAAFSGGSSSRSPG
jgi:hypothetical protein